MRALSIVLCVSPLWAIRRVNESTRVSNPQLGPSAMGAAIFRSRGASGTLRSSACDYNRSALVVWWRQGVFQDREHRDWGHPDCDVTCVEAGSLEQCSKRADAIVYHLPTAIRRLVRLSNGSVDAMEGAKPEFKGKLSIGMMMESTENYPKYSLENLTRLGYDMAATTSLASELPVFYMSDFSQFDAWGNRSIPGFRERLPAVAFMARKCGDRADLVSRLAELGVPVHSLGKCAPSGSENKHTPVIEFGDKVSVLSKYRVYLAFENSIEPGYVTEKVYDGYKAGCVGVYSGAPDIGRFVPPGTIIEISKDTVADAAVKIKEVLESEDAWNRLNWWRQTPVSEWQGGNFLRSWGAPGETPPAGFHADLGCRICRAAYAHKYPDEARFDPKTQTLQMLTRAA